MTVCLTVADEVRGAFPEKLAFMEQENSLPCSQEATSAR